MHLVNCFIHPILEQLLAKHLQLGDNPNLSNQPILDVAIGKNAFKFFVICGIHLSHLKTIGS
jgi:hypothetical protein